MSECDFEAGHWFPYLTQALALRQALQTNRPGIQAASFPHHDTAHPLAHVIDEVVSSIHKVMLKDGYCDTERESQAWDSLSHTEDVTKTTSKREVTKCAIIA